MGLNSQKGNMYPWVTHTWNPIRGRCLHDCIYCYMKVYPQPEMHFAAKEMKTDLGHGKFIFVGSSTDIWLGRMDWLQATLKHCNAFPLNRYLFQSKRPCRFVMYRESLPPNTILGTTIETNRSLDGISKAPAPVTRMAWMVALKDIPKMISIEPIMDFDLEELLPWMKDVAPEFVSIGADSKSHHLPEPPWNKIDILIQELSQFTNVKMKDNLERLRHGPGSY